MNSFSDIKELIRQDEVEEAFRALKERLVSQEAQNELIVLEGAFNKIKNDDRLGVINNENFGVEKSKIRKALIDLVDGHGKLYLHSFTPNLSPEAKTLLYEASRAPDARVWTYATKDGWSVKSNNKVLFEGSDPRKEVYWKEALVQLCEQKLFNQLESSQKLSVTYVLTSKGFKVAESISELDISQGLGFVTFFDPRDNQEYPTIKLGGQTWLARNFNFDVGEGCCFYTNDLSVGEKFGRLYSWDATQRACPLGWRLPEKQDWEALVANFGGSREAYSALLVGSGSGFDAHLGGYGYADGAFGGLEQWGGYWTATERKDREGEACFYYFGRDFKVSWDMNPKGNRYSLRFVKKID